VFRARPLLPAAPAGKGNSIDEINGSPEAEKINNEPESRDHAEGPDHVVEATPSRMSFRPPRGGHAAE